MLKTDQNGGRKRVHKNWAQKDMHSLKTCIINITQVFLRSLRSLHVTYAITWELFSRCNLITVCIFYFCTCQWQMLTWGLAEDELPCLFNRYCMSLCLSVNAIICNCSFLWLKLCSTLFNTQSFSEIVFV